MSRRWLLAWLIVLGYMTAAAYYIRAQSLAGLSTHITQQLTPYAERAQENPPGVYPRNDYIWDSQGPMVYLIEQGYRNPAMLRVMLLCESRRCYDQIYLYDRCLNWDLRVHLMEECLSAFPDDPLVHWAAGRCLLTGGEYDRAADELLKAEQLRFDAETAGVKPWYFEERIETALMMAGRIDDAVNRKRGMRDAFPDDRDAQYDYAELLTRLERYEESDAAIAEWRQAAGDDFRQYTLGLRNAWWRRDMAEFDRRAYVAADNVEDFVLLDWAGIRLALLKGNYGLAETIAGGRRGMYLRALAETYAFTGNEKPLRVIEDEIKQSKELYEAVPSGYQHSEERWAAQDITGTAEANLLRAYMLRNDWPAVIAVLDDRAWDGYDPSIDATYEFAALSANLARDYQFEKPWSWYENRAQLPWLLQSDVFEAAATSGGIDPEIARERVLADLAVERETYSDFSNGALDW